jgi:hypothetical protein
MAENHQKRPVLAPPENSRLAVRELKFLVLALVPLLILTLAYFALSDSALVWLVTHFGVAWHFSEIIMAIIGVIAFILFGEVIHGRKS